MRDAQGNLPNKPFTMFSGRLAYWAGVNTPESMLISDFSRERWQAISPLLHGVRRGDIIRDIVQHTPDPYKDSIALMYTKLQALKNSFSSARGAVLKGHNFDVDPGTGQPVGEGAAAPKEEEFGFQPSAKPAAAGKP
jgi:hypothetical protein